MAAVARRRLLARVQAYAPAGRPAPRAAARALAGDARRGAYPAGHGELRRTRRRPPRCDRGDPLHRAALGARAQRAGERARARGRRGGAARRALPSAPRRPRSSELRPWIERRLAEARQVLARDRRARAAASPTSGSPLELVAAAGAHAGAPARRAAARAGRRRRARRSSASTAGRRASEIAQRLDRATALTGSPLQRPDIRAPAHALGVVLAERAHELQLAADAGARARARLRRLARGVPPRDPRPLAALLGAARAPLARLPRGPPLAARATARRSVPADARSR